MRKNIIASFVVTTLLACNAASTGGAGGGGGADEAGDDALRARASDACWAYCEAFTACTGDEPWPMEECVDGCEAFAGCEAPAEAYFTCVADELSDGCEGLDACDALHEEARRCTLQTTSCEETPDTCSCEGRHLALPVLVSCETFDGQGGGAAVQCACSWRGELLGTCSQDAVACTVEESCCAQTLFGYGTP